MQNRNTISKHDSVYLAEMEIWEQIQANYTFIVIQIETFKMTAPTASLSAGTEYAANFWTELVLLWKIMGKD